MTIEQWGAIQWRKLEFAFSKCENLIYNATDAPDLTQLELPSLYGMFQEATSFNGDLSEWEVDQIENMSQMFLGASAFEGNGLKNWDVSKVKTMYRMFEGATNFNGDVGGWTLNVDPDGEIIMANVFKDASSFDQNLGDWNISSIATMDAMLNGTALSTENYDATLIGWADNPNTPDEITLGAQDLIYCGPEAVTARELTLVNKGWQFIGDSVCIP